MTGKLFWDVSAARRTSRILKNCVMIELVCNLILLNSTLSMGSPINLNQFLPYDNGDSWTYGYGRPISGLILISFGFLAEMHSAARIICIAGCTSQIVVDSFSSFQVGSLLQEVRYFDSPSGNYSYDSLLFYTRRDFLSLFISTLSLFLCSYLSCIVGWCQPQLISYQVIRGNDLDRASVMRQHLRANYDSKAFQNKDDI
jgi:hypothetical protein